MNPLDAKRQFALEVLQKLRAAGFAAYWAGGCVRDGLLGRTPKDYDVATNATPEQIRQVFGARKTLAIGAAFGVVAVIGPRPAGQVEVTTFRRDAQYSDGRHPDGVTFSSPEDDAQRRDFTINGLFYDPLADEVIDFVGGRDDLARRLIRAIGNPRERFAEDKLRMLRAVRFAATYAFALDGDTQAAIAEMAGEILVVSPERIAQEMRQMLVHTARAQACRLLRETCLLAAVLAEAVPLAGIHATRAAGPQAEIAAISLWDHTLGVLERLCDPSFSLALAGLLQQVGKPATLHQEAGEFTYHGHATVAGQLSEQVCRRWRLSNKELDRTCWLVLHQDSLRQAQTMPWPVLQRLLITEGIEELLALHEADLSASASDLSTVEYCRQKLELPPEVLNPPPLITGDDLQSHGVPAGKVYKILLDKVRDAQLLGQIRIKSDALRLADQLLAAGQNSSGEEG